MVILATACAPTRGIKDLAETLGTGLDAYGFIKTTPTSPVDTTVPGIFVCGCAGAASSAAQRAAETVFVLSSEKEKAVA